MGGKLCRFRLFGGDDDDDDEMAFKSMEGAQKIEEDDDIDPSLLLNSNLAVVFTEIDVDGTGQIEYDEFLQGFGLDNTPLVQKIFFLFDEDNSGALDYFEFLKHIDKYRKMTYDERLGWCFKVYDLDDSGYIDKDEFTAVVMDMNFAVRSYRSCRAMLTKMAHWYEMKYGEKLERVDCPQFKELAMAHGTLLIYPALGVMERIVGMALHDPDSHLDCWDCIRPGQAGMLLKKTVELESADQEWQSGP